MKPGNGRLRIPFSSRAISRAGDCSAYWRRDFAIGRFKTHQHITGTLAVAAGPGRILFCGGRGKAGAAAREALHLTSTRGDTLRADFNRRIAVLCDERGHTLLAHWLTQ